MLNEASYSFKSVHKWDFEFQWELDNQNIIREWEASPNTFKIWIGGTPICLEFFFHILTKQLELDFHPCVAMI